MIYANAKRKLMHASLDCERYTNFNRVRLLGNSHRLPWTYHNVARNDLRYHNSQPENQRRILRVQNQNVDRSDHRCRSSAPEETYHYICSID